MYLEPVIQAMTCIGEKLFAGRWEDVALEEVHLYAHLDLCTWIACLPAGTPGTAVCFVSKALKVGWLLISSWQDYVLQNDALLHELQWRPFSLDIPSCCAIRNAGIACLLSGAFDSPHLRRFQDFEKEFGKKNATVWQHVSRVIRRAGCAGTAPSR